MKKNKKIFNAVIIAVVIITGAALVRQFNSLQKNSDPQPTNDVSDSEELVTGSSLITIPASHVDTSGTVASIDTAKKILKVKTDDGEDLAVTYGEKTAIYQMKDKRPENKTDADIVKGAVISVQYDSNDNTAASIMIGGRWAKF